MHLWAKAHGQIEDDTPSPHVQFLIEQGQQVEEMAKAYLASCWLPPSPNQQMIWQPTYTDDQYEIRADALIWDQEAQVYDLVEIKSATKVRRKDEFDLTFQVLLLEEKMDLRHIYLLHINKDYQSDGSLDLSQYFTMEEVSNQIEKRRTETEQERQKAWQILHLDQPHPDFACTKPASCPCPSLCHPNLPEYPVYNIPRIGQKALKLRQSGIRAIKDIPQEMAFSAAQQRHITAVRQGKPLIDRAAIRQSLSGLQYPLHFLDYETFNPALPQYPGYQPYEHIVFQYSLHRIDAPGAAPQHFECLMTGPEDPAPQLVAHLLENIHATGSVIVWFQHFEAGRNRDLARHTPEQAEALLDINKRLFDLMLIFKAAYVDPQFKGSASLKAVLPVLCPALSYDNLAISHGEEAMLSWWQLQQDALLTPTERAEIKANMLAYCERDTYAMVAILDVLNRLLEEA